MAEEKKFIMRNDRVWTVKEALREATLSDIRFKFDDGSQVTFWRSDTKNLQKYENYGVKSHGLRYITEEYEIAEIPEDFYEKLAIEREAQLIPIKRIVDRRWGYNSDGRIIFEMPDGSYKYIMDGVKSGPLKESDLKPIRNAHLIKEKFKGTLTYKAKIICKMYGLKICGGDSDEGKKD